jgi:hypothetical protein
MEAMRRLRGIAVLSASLIFGCATSHDVDSQLGGNQVVQQQSPAGGGAGAAAPSAEQQAVCAKDPVDSLDGLHQHLECAGLYADIVTKKLAAGVEPYVPGEVLWSDGADKNRWIWLPKGTKIDASSPGDWTFPVGTKFFKEFAIAGHRIETRMFEKQGDRWVRTTYQWNSSETSATRSDGGDIMANGSPYHLPTAKECDECHQGRRDRSLGFEQIAMGLDTATGLTLAKLAQKNLISPVPADLHPKLADDGTGNALAVVGWLHINCGVSCHNDSPSAAGHSTKLRMKLDPSLLDGRSATMYPTLQTTIGTPATTVRWNGKKRIVPGSPETSLLYQLVSSRGGMDNDQMPPLATKIVDQEKVDAIAKWIRSLPAQ